MDDRNFEAQLRTALKPVAAPDGLAERILQRAEARNAKKRRAWTQQTWLRWGALAAMLTVGTFGGLKWNEQRQAQQLEARRAAEQFSLAMHIATKTMSRVQKNLIIEVPLHPSRGGQ